MCLVPFRYFNTIFSFTHSSSSGILNIVVRNDTAVCMSLLYCDIINIKCANKWWNISDQYSSRNYASSYPITWNKWSAVGVARVSMNSSGNLSRTFYRYFVIEFLPALSLNNSNPFLDNHVSLLYAPWFCYNILLTSIGKIWSL